MQKMKMHEMHKITMKRCTTCIKQQFYYVKKIENDKIEKGLLKINGACAKIQA